MINQSIGMFYMEFNYRYLLLIHDLQDNGHCNTEAFTPLFRVKVNTFNIKASSTDE